MGGQWVDLHVRGRPTAFAKVQLIKTRIRGGPLIVFKPKFWDFLPILIFGALETW